jgi:hypothetical protein
MKKLFAFVPAEKAYKTFYFSSLWRKTLKNYKTFPLKIFSKLTFQFWVFRIFPQHIHLIRQTPRRGKIFIFSKRKTSNIHYWACVGGGEMTKWGTFFRLHFSFFSTKKCLKIFLNWNLIYDLAKTDYCVVHEAFLCNVISDRNTIISEI